MRYPGDRPAEAPFMAQPALRRAAIALLYLALFLALDRLALAFRTTSGITLWSPSSGLALALLLVLGYQRAPLVFVGVLLNSLWLTPRPWPLLIMVLLALDVALIYGLAALVLKRLFQLEPQLRRARDVAALSMVAVLASLLVAVVAAGILVAHGDVPSSDYWASTVQRWLGDAIGLLALTPFLLAHALPAIRTRAASGLAFPHRLPRPSYRVLTETMVSLLGALLLVWIAFEAGPSGSFPRAYIAFLPVVAVTLRYGLRGATAETLLTAMGAGLVVGRSQLSAGNAVELQTLLLFLAGTALFTGASVAAHREVEETLRKRTEQLEALLAIIAATTTTTDLRTLLHMSLDATLHALALDMGAIWTQGECVTQRVSSEIAVLCTEHQALSAALGTEILIVPDWDQIPQGDVLEELGQGMLKLGIQGTLVTPIKLNGARVGALALCTSTPHRWPTDDIALAEAVCWQLGQAVRQLRLLDQIQRQAQQLQCVIDTVPQGVILLDADLCVLLMNPAAKESFCVLTEAGIGDKLAQLGDQRMDDLLGLRHSPYWLEINTAGLFARAFQAALRPLDSGDKLQGWVLVLHEVTEERLAQERLRQQQRLAAVGQLAAGIAHDFNNLLTGIIGMAELIEFNPDATPQIRSDLHMILHEGQRGARLVRQMLDFGRRSISTQHPLELADFVHRAWQLLCHNMPREVHCALAVEPGDYVVNADSGQIEQMLSNLILNACEAMPSGGKLTVDLGRLHLEPEDDRPLHDMRAGDWVSVSVRDTGVGITPEAFAHLYEPFFTTKSPALNSGLGLAQVYGIVQQHHGHIDIKSQVGQGTTVMIYLPRAPILEMELGGRSV